MTSRLPRCEANKIEAAPSNASWGDLNDKLQPFWALKGGSLPCATFLLPFCTLLASVHALLIPWHLTTELFV